MFFISGGKHTLPSDLPSQYYKGFVGCMRNLKIFRRRVDLLRSGDNSNIRLCDA